MATTSRHVMSETFLARAKHKGRERLYNIAHFNGYEFWLHHNHKLVISLSDWLIIIIIKFCGAISQLSGQLISSSAPSCQVCHLGFQGFHAAITDSINFNIFLQPF